MSGTDRPPRVLLPERGPLLIDGPVDLVLPDGTELHCERPVVAVCTCRRSRHYPLCDTSHRRHTRPATGNPDGSGTDRADRPDRPDRPGADATAGGAPPFPPDRSGQTLGRAQNARRTNAEG
ncbi:CDGSH iron-sulfur domain-containing protein [Kitasatospora sp. NPDC088134]|uniref:CDGSH iron-sulfur domain-containing protein n=1 Tax=Kitasatospora sp. NPDC088134 TaxID=3364071 RepID=UPI00380D871C